MSAVSDADRPARRDLVWISLICLVPSAAGFLEVAVRNPAYLRDYTLNANPDAVHYVLLGRNVWTQGIYSRQRADERPYRPDMLRTPVYPLIAGGLDLLLGAWAVYAFQVLCRTATALALYGCCLPLFGRGVARLAALLLALDLMLAVLDFETMSEPLFDLLATLSVLLWLRDLFPAAPARPCWQHALLIGLLVGLAALTRPTGLYLAIGLGGIELILAGIRRSGAVLKHATAMVGMALLIVLLWIVRNDQVFGIARLTTADRLTLIFDAGAGAYSVEHDLTTEEARERIHREFGIGSYLDGNNHWRTNRSVKEMDDELGRVQYAVLFRYPRSLLIATMGGLARAALSHNVDTYATLTHRSWDPPGLGTLLRGHLDEFLRRLCANDAILVGLFLWEVAFALFVLAAAAVGLLVGLRRKEWRGPILCVMLIMGYYALTIAAVGLPAYARHRSMLVPFLCLLAAVGLGRKNKETSAQA